MFLFPFIYDPVILQLPLSLIVVLLLVILILALPLIWFHEEIKEFGREKLNASIEPEATINRCTQCDEAVHTEAPESAGDKEI